CNPPKTGPVPRTLADCERSDLQCGLGDDAKCGPLADFDANCPGFTRCAKGAYCAPDIKCVATLATGSACTKNEECTSEGCVRGKCGANGIGSVTPCTGASQ